MRAFNQLGIGYRILIVLFILIGFYTFGRPGGSSTSVGVGLMLAGIVFFIGWRRSRGKTERTAAKVTPRSSGTIELKGDGSFEVEVVGESHYQTALESICGPRTRDSVSKHVEAVLILDDLNKHDKSAVRVEIGGKAVGYLDRDDALTYRDMLEDMQRPKAKATCAAHIVGGWDRGTGDRGSYGVYLDFDLG